MDPDQGHTHLYYTYLLHKIVTKEVFFIYRRHLKIKSMYKYLKYKRVSSAGWLYLHILC